MGSQQRHVSGLVFHFNSFQRTHYLKKNSYRIFRIWVQLLDRRQQRLEIVLLSVENFTEPPPNIYYLESHLPPASPPAHVIYSQNSDVWINVS